MADFIQVKDATGATVSIATKELSAGLHAGVRREEGFAPIGSHTTNSTLSSAVTMTPATGANKLLVQAFTANVRYTLDGTTPTASVGFQLLAGDPPTIIMVGTSLALKIIQESAGAAVQYQWAQ